jgi:hypothetical protein
MLWTVIGLAFIVRYLYRKHYQRVGGDAVEAQLGENPREVNPDELVGIGPGDFDLFSGVSQCR